MGSRRSRDVRRELHVSQPCPAERSYALDSATIVVVPREGFHATRRSLESIVSVTRPGYKLVYVDGGSPRATRRYLEDQARRFQFTLIRTDHYLSQNEARNIGLQHAQSKYVVFIDNDVVVAPGWLDALVGCADDTDAWAVGVLNCIHEPVHQIVHMGGGTSGISDEAGKRVYHEHHDYVDSPLAEALTHVQRHETNLVELHCALVRRDTFDKIGPFDESLLSAPEHADLCLSVQAAGGSLYFEPGAVVTQLAPPPVTWSDLPYFVLRWSAGWNERSISHFHDKWHLSSDSEHHRGLATFLNHRRSLYFKTLGLQPLRSLLLVTRGEHALSSFDAAVDRLATRIWFNPAERKRTRRRPPVLRYAP